ncbi:MAG: hypothetical protein JSV79_09290 [Armatimonadota bacterium]|nr:MAG: hypothetical protein JSV79_09290 [Armatimonadota bacterium]
MSDEFTPALRPDLFGQLAATDPFQGRARRLFERGQVLAVNGNQADLRVGYDAHNNPLELREVPIISGYVPRVGDWVSIQYEAGHSGSPWVTGPSMAADESQDSAGIGVFSVSSQEPSDPQKSTIYFDDSAGTWRGWNGTAWVDIPTELHNTLTDLQGGSPGGYYHFSAAEHGALQDLYDGDGMASAYMKRLLFKAVGTSATQRTRMFEKDGDFFWAINATYDEQADQWNRIDTTKYAYLIALHSKNNIPTEPIGGAAWWRAVPGNNPIGDYAAVGGWQLGFMMTEHRNYVMGGMNLELDGSGAPPYGRFTQIGSNDPSGTVVTAMQRNSWYEGSGQWGRDSHDKSSAIIGLDEDANLFVWWYPDSSQGNAPWATSAWQQRARLNLSGSVRGRLDVIRSSGETNIGCSAFLSKHKTSGDMVDGFAAGYALAIEDSAGTENVIAAIYGVRAGADNTGALSFRVASGGSLAERMRLTSAQVLLPSAGSAAVPAIARSSYADDGIYWPANGQVGITTSGALRASVLDNHLKLEDSVGIAAGIAYNSAYPFYLRGYFADTSGAQYGLLLGSLWQPGQDNHSGTMYGFMSSPTWLPAGAHALAAARSIVARVATAVAGATVSSVCLFDSWPYFYGSADASTSYTTVFDFYARERGGAGTIGTRYAFYIPSDFSTGVTTPWGIFIDDDIPSRMNGKLAIGAEPLSNQADVSLLRDGVLAMRETTTPTPDANHGKLYTKSDNKLYFQDGAGTEHQVAFA